MINTEKYVNNIPYGMRKYKQWVLFKTYIKTDRNGNKKTSKIPISPVTFRAKGWNERKSWIDFDNALISLKNSNCDGLAFVLTNHDPFICIDLDNCITYENAFSNKLAEECVKLFENTYMEISHSGNGIHIFLEGEIPKNINNQTKGIEIYKENHCISMTGEISNTLIYPSRNIINRQSDLDKIYKKMSLNERYKAKSNSKSITITEEVPDADSIIEIMCKYNNTAKELFEGALVSGDWSKDDFHLLLLLNSYTHGNEYLMEDIFLKSNLSRAEEKSKRIDRESYLKYLRKSIKKAVEIGNSNYWQYKKYHNKGELYVK